MSYDTHRVDGPAGPAEDLDELGRLFDRFEALRVERGARLHEHAPAVSGWSAAQHLYHLALATDLAFRNVKSLVADRGRLIVDDDGPTELARQVLAGGGPGRGESEAPRMVRPGEVVDPSFLEMELGQNRAVLVELRALAPKMADAPRRIPHQDLGPLSALEWLHFARLHARHHLALVEDVLAQLDGSEPGPIEAEGPTST